MIIHGVSKIQDRDISAFCWLRLRSFHNTQFTARKIMHLQEIPVRYRVNVEKQAEQIRFSLIQAREYYTACKSVTLSTRPTLLYYSAMCLVTAEILFKQSGDSSLDRARESHRHHGLSFTNSNKTNNKNYDNIETILSGLVAKPAIRENKQRYGTFDLWHRSARGYPLPAHMKKVFPDLTTQTSFQAIAIEKDIRMRLLQEQGISLFNIMRNIPGLHFSSNTIRGRVEVSETNDDINMAIAIHPDFNKDNISRFLENCLFNANHTEQINYIDMGNGGIINITTKTKDILKMSIPPSTVVKSESIHFWTEDQCLNEFGFIYIGLFIVGNYARYYPDHWMRDVETGTETGVLIERFLQLAEERIAILILSELDQVFYIPD